MSGGHFDYIQYRFSEIVEDMEEIINKQKEYDLDEEAVSHIQTGIKLLLTAGIYLQRIDWLVSGDDGLETFKKRLEEDLLNVPFHFENNPISLKIKKNDNRQRSS